jgi:hypothetical protein
VDADPLEWHERDVAGVGELAEPELAATCEQLHLTHSMTSSSTRSTPGSRKLLRSSRSILLHPRGKIEGVNNL